MSEKRKSYNTKGIEEHAKRKSQEARKSVDEAIKKLIKNKEKINFNTVAEQAGVTKPFLYGDEQIRSRIETLREQQKGVKSAKSVKRNMTDASKDGMIEILKNRIKELESQNKRLEEENKKYRGEIYDQI